MNTRRGSTLIELMIAIAIIGIGVGAWTTDGTYQSSTHRQELREATVRALEAELEAIAACPDRACIDRSVRKPSAEVRDVAARWAPTELRRSVEPGPDGTLEVRLRAPMGKGLGRPIEVRRLVRVSR